MINISQEVLEEFLSGSGYYVRLSPKPFGLLFPESWAEVKDLKRSVIAEEIRLRIMNCRAKTWLLWTCRF